MLVICNSLWNPICVMQFSSRRVNPNSALNSWDLIKPNSPRVIYQFRIHNERTDFQSASISSIVNATTLAISSASVMLSSVMLLVGAGRYAKRFRSTALTVPVLIAW